MCVIGVEPNPHHRARLTTVQKLRAAGAGVLFLLPPRAMPTAWCASRFR